ncbi:MAG: ABC transporter ATP-binding protein [Firmicutes bacterium]|nr:ABC transporter ATP-binding protein [Bacillota bacterium]
MLKITDFSKKYHNATRFAIENLSLELEPGEIFGFLGNNGAGKSTTIKSVVGILPYSDGTIEIGGIDLRKDPEGAKRLMGYVPDDHAVFLRLTGREYVNHMANIYRVSIEDRDRRAAKYLKLFNLEKAYDSLIKSYSHGMKQKICVIAALIHNPKLWILDEPLMGLDPQSSFQLKESLKNHAMEGNTVFFSSHILDVVEKLCQRVGIIKDGQLMGVFKVSELDEPLEKLYIRLTEDEVAQDDETIETEN